MGDPDISVEIEHASPKYTDHAVASGCGISYVFNTHNYSNNISIENGINTLILPKIKVTTLNLQDSIKTDLII
jgi:hypothetical protein